MHLLLLLSLAAAPAPADEPCALEGTVVLEADGKPVAGTVVAYVENVPAKARAHTPVTHRVRQHNRQFDPQVLVVIKQDIVEFVNEDKDEHGVFSNSEPATFDFPYTPKGVTGQRVFSQVGPVRVQCDIHQKMRADVLVVPSRFFATADEQGRWRIAELPRGRTYKVTFWEPNGAQKSQEVTCSAGLMRVGQVTLERAAAPALLRRNGEAYHWNN